MRGVKDYRANVQFDGCIMMYYAEGDTLMMYSETNQEQRHFSLDSFTFNEDSRRALPPAV